MSPQYPGGRDRQPDGQWGAHRRSNRSAAGQIWETALWLEMTFFSFLFPVSLLLPMSFLLSNCLTSHVFHVCCHRSILIPGALSRQDPVESVFFQIHADLHTNKHPYTHTQTQKHCLIDCLLPGNWQIIQYTSKRQLSGTLLFVLNQLTEFHSVHFVHLQLKKVKQVSEII